jgi:hypothetical protein
MTIESQSYVGGFYVSMHGVELFLKVDQPRCDAVGKPRQYSLWDGAISAGSLGQPQSDEETKTRSLKGRLREIGDWSATIETTLYLVHHVSPIGNGTFQHDTESVLGNQP